MSEKTTKLIRKQIKNVVQSLLPEVFNAESIKTMERVLITRQDSRLSEITSKVQQALETMDQRSKDLQSYVVRNTGVIQAPNTEELNPPLYSPTAAKSLEKTLETSAKSDDASLD